MADITGLFVTPTSSIRETLMHIERSGEGIALVVDGERRLLGTITDGDIRRAILAGMSLDVTVEVLLRERKVGASVTSVTAAVGTSESQLLQLMNEHGIRHIPIVDQARRVVDVALLSRLVKDYELPLRAVVMAGGLGMRLRPLTDDVPKPMLRLGGRPLLEVIIEQLRQAGIRHVNVTTHYRGEVIAEHFGDGRDFGVEIQYVREDQPLGTAGALSQLGTSNEPLLVINGDILTRLDIRAMLNFHREQHADMTVGVRQHEFRIPYGVLETEGVAIVNISEKPAVKHLISAGIYLLNPEVCQFVPNSQAYDMPHLISRLVAEKRRVVSFLVHEYWLDIGEVEDYRRAVTDMLSGEF